MLRTLFIAGAGAGAAEGGVKFFKALLAAASAIYLEDFSSCLFVSLRHRFLKSFAYLSEMSLLASDDESLYSESCLSTNSSVS